MSKEKEKKSKEEKPKKQEPVKEEPVKKDAQKPEVEAEKPEEIEDLEIVAEKTYTINLRDVWTAPRNKRSPKAIKALKEYMKRHMKAEDVIISNEVNEQVWARGIQKPPRKLTVRAVKDKENKVLIFPIKT
jgi:large subunit ribosomal protein L31e